jgi:N-acetylneuraminic acid mutarotase
MPTGRDRFALAVAGSKLYAIGGSSFDGALATVEEYDPSSDMWTTKTNMPTPRFNIGAATAPSGKIYVFGSWSEVEEYDPTSNTWAIKASMPTPRFGPGVAVAPNGKIYVIGGGSWPNAYSTVEEYNPATNTWSTKASMPTARYNLGVATAANGKIYAVGGFTGWDAGISCCRVNVLEEYDPVTDTWSTKASAFTARAHVGMIGASHGRLYMIGGSPNDGAIPTTTEEYDPTTDTWNIRAGMPTSRWGMGVALANNGNIYAIGGGGAISTNEEATIIVTSPPLFQSPISDANITKLGAGFLSPSAPTHLGQDYWASHGTEVRAISRATVGGYFPLVSGFGGWCPASKDPSCAYSTPGPALWLRHRLFDGRFFHVLYGHMTPSQRVLDIVSGRLPRGTVLEPAEAIGNLAPFLYCGSTSIPHLHLGVWLEDSVAPSPWGYGAKRKFVDPVSFLRTERPFP